MPPFMAVSHIHCDYGAHLLKTDESLLASYYLYRYASPGDILVVWTAGIVIYHNASHLAMTLIYEQCRLPTINYALMIT